jgi:SAM-dependent methyltransferase
MKLDATQVQLNQEVVRTPDDIRRRYRENRDWQLYPKEWIFRNIPMEGKDVLDFGCGTGEITSQIAMLGANKVYGLDVTPGLLDQTQRRAELDGLADRVETVCGMIQDVEPRPVDVIIAFAVLHHCFPLENVLPALLRWLKPGGIFVTVEPVNYLPAMEWLRSHSGIPTDPLDEGERKLSTEDLQYVRGLFSRTEITHFHLLGRLSRIWPNTDKTFRQMDRRILSSLPAASKLAGTALVVGYGK